MRISTSKGVCIIFEDYEKEDAMRWKQFYISQGYAVSDEFTDPPKGEQGYVDLLISVKFESKRK